MGLVSGLPPSREVARREPQEIEIILSQRKSSWTRWPDDADQRWGASTAAEWKTLIDVTAKSSNNPQLAQQIGDVSNVFTNELVDEANNFDRAAVVRQAKEFRFDG